MSRSDWKVQPSVAERLEDLKAFNESIYNDDTEDEEQDSEKLKRSDSSENQQQEIQPDDEKKVEKAAEADGAQGEDQIVAEA